MGQCRSQNYVVEQEAQSVCTSARPAQERAEKEKKGKFFRWARKSKKTSIDAQESQCSDDGQSQGQCSDDAIQQLETVDSQERAEKEKKGKFFRWARKSKKTSIDAQESQCSDDGQSQCRDNNNQHIVIGDVHRSWSDDENQEPETSDGQESQCGDDATQQPERCSDGDHASDTESASESSCASFHTANEGIDTRSIDLSVDEAEQDSTTDSWHTCASSLTPEPEEEKDHPGQEQASSSSEESSSSASPAHDTAWTDEDELINLSLKGKTGDVLQHYVCLKLLGRGSYGKVFEGIRLSDSRKVALKYVEKNEYVEIVRTGLFGKTLPNEVAIMALLSKGPSVAQIIKLLDWYETPTEYILVLERPAPCVDMRVFLLQHGGRTGESTARAVMRQVVTAARICCERGIFHGDIKLENLLINENTLQVKLIDFGSSMRLMKSAYLTFRGTKVYTPPESVNHGKFHGKPATVYALGVVLFKILSGKYPRTPKQLAEILTEPWYTEEISKECQDLISACMESDPAKRIDLEKILLHDWFQALILN